MRQVLIFIVQLNVAIAAAIVFAPVLAIVVIVLTAIAVGAQVRNTRCHDRADWLTKNETVNGRTY
jgi:fatty acid desaturase